MGFSQVIYSKHGQSIDLSVNVYSVPKYNFKIWMRNGNLLPQSSKYTISDVVDVLTDTFYGTKVHVDGYVITLSIKNLEDEDFGNYTLVLSNGLGKAIDHQITVLLQVKDNTIYIIVTFNELPTLSFEFNEKLLENPMKLLVMLLKTVCKYSSQIIFIFITKFYFEKVPLRFVKWFL